MRLYCVGLKGMGYLAKHWKALLHGAPFVAFLLHVTLYGDWIVDDAGITFAYARSLVEGHGFVAQIGAAPVEGFTNLLWLLLQAPFIALG